LSIKAIKLNPGTPFTNYCNDEQGKGVYVLNGTSNPGAVDFQRNIPKSLKTHTLFLKIC